MKSQSQSNKRAQKKKSENHKIYTHFVWLHKSIVHTHQKVIFEKIEALNNGLGWRAFFSAPRFIFMEFIAHTNHFEHHTTHSDSPLERSHWTSQSKWNLHRSIHSIYNRIFHHSQSLFICHASFDSRHNTIIDRILLREVSRLHLFRSSISNKKV